MTNTVKQFAAAAEEAADQGSLELTHPFTLGGKDYVARLPTKSEVAFWFIGIGNGNEAGYEETIRFMRAVLHDSTWDGEDGDLIRDEDGEYAAEIPDEFNPNEQANDLFRRWRNPRDPLDVDDCIPVIRWLIEERTNFPTTSSSGSSSGRQKSGQSSTRATPAKASTRSRSPRAASAD